MCRRSRCMLKNIFSELWERFMLYWKYPISLSGRIWLQESHCRHNHWHHWGECRGQGGRPFSSLWVHWGLWTHSLGNSYPALVGQRRTKDPHSLQVYQIHLQQSYLGERCCSCRYGYVLILWFPIRALKFSVRLHEDAIVIPSFHPFQLLWVPWPSLVATAMTCCLALLSCLRGTFL